MVGHHRCNEHMAEREEEGGEQRGIGAGEREYLAEYPIHEDGRIDGAEHDNRHHKEDGEVGAGGLHEPVVCQVHGIEEGEKKRMARRLEMHTKVGQRDIRPAVVARNAEVLGENRPETEVAALEEQRRILVYHKCIERYEHYQRNDGDESFFFLYLEHCFSFYFYFIPQPYKSSPPWGD